MCVLMWLVCRTFRPMLPSEIRMHRAPPATASQLIPENGYQSGDLMITKRQWGAFYGTELDQQLRRRGIRTIILGGVATNFGVESTARAAFDRGYEVIFVEDAMTSISAEVHHLPAHGASAQDGRSSNGAGAVTDFSRRQVPKNAASGVS
jgi:nicotinamidase-related amidase